MDDARPRLLVLGGASVNRGEVLDALRGHFEITVVDSHDKAMAALREGEYRAVLSDAGDFLPLERGLVGQKSSLVLDTIGEGVCIVDREGTCTWANKQMSSFPRHVTQRVSQICEQALTIFADQTSSPDENRRMRSKKFTFHDRDDRHYEVMTSPVVQNGSPIRQVVAVVWDATSGKRLQQKIDAIDAAGRELARLESDAIARLGPSERLELLRDKIIRYSRELMHFDHFGIRVLDRRTNKLEVVIAEGLPNEATEIELHAEPEGNGICGYVAATGHSYICHDTEKDPLYVMGLEHCLSSLTVPLMLYDKVIGVYNIESQTPGAFNEDDRQFAEIFGRYVAIALNILDLLVKERIGVSGQMQSSVLQEVAQPLNDLVTDAQELMDACGSDPAIRKRLEQVQAGVLQVRDTVRNVAMGPRAVLGMGKMDRQADPLITGKRILVADDEDRIRQTIADVLGKYGAICTVAKDGHEAVTFLEQREFDLVLSDIRMPYRNGYEIFAAARRQNPDVPVMLMTGFGYDPSHSVVRAHQEGLSTVLFKPFKVDQLLEEVRKALSPATASQ